jgi:hypothetical protein
MTSFLLASDHFGGTAAEQRQLRALLTGLRVSAGPARLICFAPTPTTACTMAPTAATASTQTARPPAFSAVSTSVLSTGAPIPHPTRPMPRLPGTWASSWKAPPTPKQPRSPA